MSCSKIDGCFLTMLNRDVFLLELEAPSSILDTFPPIKEIKISDKYNNFTKTAVNYGKHCL